VIREDRRCNQQRVTGRHQQCEQTSAAMMIVDHRDEINANRTRGERERT
jgi:hypothetical protein